MGNDEQSKKIGEFLEKIFTMLYDIFLAIILGIFRLRSPKKIIIAILLILISVFARMYYGPFLNLIKGIIDGKGSKIEVVYLEIIKYLFNYLPGIVVLIYLCAIGSKDSKQKKV